MVKNYKEITNKAYNLHSQNKIEEAENLYIKLLEIAPEDVNILNLYGLLCISKGDFEGYRYLYKDKLSWWRDIERRLKEACKLGFRKAIIPCVNSETYKKINSIGLELKQVKKVTDAIIQGLKQDKS